MKRTGQVEGKIFMNTCWKIIADHQVLVDKGNSSGTGYFQNLGDLFYWFLIYSLFHSFNNIF